MENLKIKSELISLEKQIEILERTKSLRDADETLCNVLFKVIMLELSLNLARKYTIEEFIPLFIKENAIKYCNAETSSLVWWGLKPQDFRYRVNFLDWMITKIKEEIKKEKLKK